MTDDTRNKLRDLAVSDTGFVFDPYSGSTFSVNKSGLTILDGLKAGKDRAEIIAALSEAFEVRGDDLERDLDEFCHLLRQSGLVPRDFEV